LDSNGKKGDKNPMSELELEKKLVAAAQKTRERDYWQNRLAGQWEKALFPYDNPADREETRKTVTFEVPEIERLTALSRGNDYTLNVILQSVLILQLFRYTGNEDIIIGTPTFKQEVEGDYINTVQILRNRLEPSMTFKSLLMAARQTVVEATENQNYPAEIIPDQLGRTGQADDDYPIFDVSMILENVHDTGGLRTIKHNVTLSFKRHENGIEGTLHTVSGRYGEETVRRIADHYIRLLQDAVNNLDKPLPDFDLLTAGEEQTLLEASGALGQEDGRTESRQPVYILDRYKRLQPVGVWGNEWVGGENHGEEEQMEWKKGPGAPLKIHRTGKEARWTPAGTLEYRKYPEPRQQDGPQYEAPRNHIETILTEIWQDILGKKPIGIHENFLMIGGDSIKSIQVASRMNRAGYRVEIRDIFQYPTISQLAPQVKKLERIAYQGVGTGSVPLTPVQKRFFQQYRTDSHHHNQSVMLYGKDGFEPKQIEEVFTTLKNHHDQLRATFKTNDDGTVTQEIHGLDFPISLEEHQITDTREPYQRLEEIANRLQASIDLEKGPLMKLGLFHMEDGDRLLIVLHHLVTDGISWRLLFEDIDALMKHVKNPPPEDRSPLPLKTDSFKLWAENLTQYAAQDGLLKEKEYWAPPQTDPPAPIPKDKNGDNLEKDKKIESFQMEPEETARLLGDVNRAYGTGMNDILITALGQGVKATFGMDKIQIALEGHGREEILGDLEVNRTVGWFTSVYPVRLDNSFTGDQTPQGMGRQIMEVKEALHRVPNRGIGYGILKYLTPYQQKEDITFPPEPQIIFNYLGQFDADIKRDNFEICRDYNGDTRSPRNRREFELEVVGMVLGKRLLMSITYSREQYEEATVKQLAENYKIALKDIITHCAAKPERELTPSDLIYDRLTIDELRQLCEDMPVEDVYPLSPMQEGMLFHWLYDPGSSAYFEQIAYRLQGPMNIEDAEASLVELTKRHEVLRTVFLHENHERPIQVVLKEKPVDFKYHDIRNDTAGSEPEKERLVRLYKEEDIRRTFDLGQDPLMRVTVLHIDQNEYEYIWSHHHIIMDGWCLGILIAEYLEYYYSRRENRKPRQTTVNSYRNYIRWLERQDPENSRLYWKYQMDGYADAADLPKIKAHKKVGEEYRRAETTLVVEKDETAKLNRIATENGVTLNTLVRTVWAIVLGKYSGHDDVVYGAVVSGRPPEIDGVESMIGLFINTIPVRIKLDEGISFKQLMQNHQQDSIESEKHHYYPLAKIQSDTQLKQNLLDHILVFENYPVVEQIDGMNADSAQEINDHHLMLSKVESFEQTNFDFNIIVVAKERLTIKMAYNEEMYDGQLMQRVRKHIRQVLDHLLQDAEQPIDRINYITEEEKRKILEEFNDTAATFDREKTIQRCFEEQAERSPHRTALIDPDRAHLSYGELNRRAAIVAAHLQEKGVRHNTIIAITAERSLEMFIGILGILKAGGAYLSIAPDLPQERIDYIVNDSNVKVILKTSGIKTFNSESNPVTPQVLNLDHLGDEYVSNSDIGASDISSSSLVYVIYTSGSTGRPKGVLVQHRGLLNLVEFHRKVFEEDQCARISQVASASFDAMAFEMWPALSSGSALCIIDDETRMEPRRMKEWLFKHQITISFQSTQMAQYLMEEDWPKSGISLKKVSTAGDRLTQYPTRTLPFQFYNLYGPTEDTVWTTWTEVPVNVDPLSKPPTIGKPAANKHVYILGPNSELQPVGVIGELCIAGDGLARGYLNNPELTAEKFEQDLTAYRDFSGVNRDYKPYRCYRSGDLARWLPDGNIEFVGRIDHQVKIRGYRIELGEIEVQLLKHPEVKETVVLPEITPGGNSVKGLTAYIVPDGELKSTIPELREFLYRTLPDYMVPSGYVEVEKIPVNINGKIDKKALADTGKRMDSGVQYEAPENDTEKHIARIWADVLQLEKVGKRDNFFDLGGNSISVIQVTNKLKQQLEKDIPVVTVFEYPTVETLAHHLDRRDDENVDDDRQELEKYDVMQDEALDVMDQTLQIIQGDDDE
jgi:amino acid adenylation domain-containing protein/non-ribosomal peptide synthase protein (TIGR01720 family)